MIGILNYGMGNLLSVKNALDHLTLPNKFVLDATDAQDCTRLILPGVGAFGQAMEKLNEKKFDHLVKEFVSDNKPVLGICLGMQLLFEGSTEHGSFKGLGIINGHVKDLREKVNGLRVPHVGWNNLEIMEHSRLLKGVSSADNFYFVHSYYCDATDKTVVTGRTDYGFMVDVVVEKENVFGCQFHPEKSQSAGLRLLQNFSAVS